MNSDTWQELLLLETSDAVRSWHKALFDQELNTRRVAEITSAARQAREFFRNAAQAHTSVRSLLSFYGVASLSRATLLLFKPGTGEAGLAQGHGLTAADWTTTISGETHLALSRLDSLQVRTCSGLFSDFVRQTKNLLCVHINSSAVEARVPYEVPATETRLCLRDLLSRLPDVLRYLPSDRDKNAVIVSETSFTRQNGFFTKLNTEQFAPIAPYFAGMGYQITQVGEHTKLSCTAEMFDARTPLFTHAYVGKSFGIPTLHIASPLERGVCYSQTALTYVTSYFLGMLTRYFPTQWVALSSATKGDSLWPAISAAQRYVETSFPELILELIHEVVANPDVIRG